MNNINKTIIIILSIMCSGCVFQFNGREVNWFKEEKPERNYEDDKRETQTTASSL